MHQPGVLAHLWTKIGVIENGRISLGILSGLMLLFNLVEAISKERSFCVNCSWYPPASMPANVGWIYWAIT